MNIKDKFKALPTHYKILAIAVAFVVLAGVLKIFQ